MRGFCVLCVALLIVVPAATSRAGDPTPPPGPITGTMKTLTQVEPRTPLNSLPGDANTAILINEPGSYYLTGDIVVTGQKDGIRVSADHVSIDLNGYRLIGPGNLTSVGIVCNGSRINFTLRNGTLTGWGYASLNIGGFMRHCLFEDLTLTNNPAGNLEQNDVDHSIFRNIRVKGSGEVGIAMGDNCVMSNCTIEGCHAGISGTFNCVVSDCTVMGATGTGIGLFGGGVIERCAVRSCPAGLYVGSGGIIRDCSVTSCAVAIESGGFARIQDCVIMGSTTVGVRILQRDHVVGVKISNSAIGIQSTPTTNVRNIIDGNIITTCPVGVRVLGAGSIITKNLVTESTTNPFDIAPGNTVGTIQPSPVGAGAWDNIAF